MEQKMEAEDEKDMEELSFVPSAVREPRWTLHMCDSQCGEEGFEFFETAAFATEHAINLCKQCYNVRRVKEGEEEVTGSKWRALVEQEAFRGKLWATFGMEHHQKCVDQIGLGRCSKCQAKWNGRQVATRETRACAAQQ